MSKHKKYIISGGGTGGHIYPAIAIANALKERDASCEVLFVGANGRMEMEKVPKAGYDIIGLDITGIQRSFSPSAILKNLAFPFKLLKSLSAAKKIVKDFKPDAAIGVGGYASGPLLKAAGKLGVPTLIQEQNSYAGKTNKWLSQSAKKICVAYPNMEKYFPKEKIVFTGNPVRKDILNISDKKEEAFKHFGLVPDKPVVFVFGGSLGARTINIAVRESLNKFLEKDVQIIWQTGRWYYEEAKQVVEELNDERIRLFEFVYEMDLAYALADVVVSRAGALSISELCLVGKPCILVPSPNVAEDHQTKNAMALVEQNAAIIVKDTDAKEKLLDHAFELLNNKENIKLLSSSILKLGKPNAANEIAEQVERIAK